MLGARNQWHRYQQCGDVGHTGRVGAHGADPNGAWSGEIYVVYGEPPPTPTPTATATPGRDTWRFPGDAAKQATAI